MIYEPLCGTSIDTAADKMCLLSRERNETVSASFNGIELFAYPHSITHDIVSVYEKECDRTLAERRESRQKEWDEMFPEEYVWVVWGRYYHDPVTDWLDSVWKTEQEAENRKKFVEIKYEELHNIYTVEKIKIGNPDE